MNETRSIQGLRLLALALAIMTWYFVRLDEGGDAANVVSFTNEYTIQYVVPDSLVILSSAETVQLTIEGRESIVARFNPLLVRVRVDISEDQLGVHEFEFTSANVELPDGLTVTGFEPDAVTVTTDEQTTQVKSVIAPPTGEPAAGAKVQEINVSPALVTVRGPKSVLEMHEQLTTPPIDLTGHAIDFEERSIILLPSPTLKLVSGDRSAVISVKLAIPGTDPLDGQGEPTADGETAAPPRDGGTNTNPGGTDAANQTSDGATE